MIACIVTMTLLSVKVNSNYYRGGLKYLSTFLYSCDNFGDIIALWPVNDSAAKKIIAVTHYYFYGLVFIYISPNRGRPVNINSHML